jgi:hypothetical protein
MGRKRAALVARPELGGITRVNGEGSVQIDRGRWLYRLTLDTGNIAIYRIERAGQALVPTEVWRCLATLGISDAFIVPVEGGWQPFIELADARERWALERRNSSEEAEAIACHFLGTLADAVAHAAQGRFSLGDAEHDTRALSAPGASPAASVDQAVATALAEAQAARESVGWELVYSRQRAVR